MEFQCFIGNKQINETEVYYEFYQHPSACQTIVLIHGFLSSTFSFRKLIPLLTRDYNVLSIDLPPFGKSGKSTRYVFSYQNFAQTVVKLMNELHINFATIVGHSLGGQIALHIVHSHPNTVHKAVLLCSSAYRPKTRRSLIWLSYFPFFHHYVKYWLGRSGVEKNLQAVVYDHSHINQEMHDGYLQPFLNSAIFPALTKMLRDLEGDLSAKQIANINAPCLLIWGEHDRVVPLQIGEKLNQHLQHSELIVLNEAGHLIPEEKPEDVYRCIKNFLEE